MDYVIPANDDASKSIEKILTHVTDAVAAGLAERKAEKTSKAEGADTPKVEAAPVAEKKEAPKAKAKVAPVVAKEEEE